MFDVQTAGAVAGGEAVTPLPISLEGLRVYPGVETPSSQVTGAGATVLAARYGGGRVRMPRSVRDFAPAEVVIVSEDNYLALGEAVYATAVGVQHRNAGGTSVLFVLGAIAALADAVAPTVAEIKEALGLDDYATVAVCGDVRFHRSADTVIDVAVTDKRRPAYIDDGLKTGLILDPADQSAMGGVPAGHIDFPVDLTGYSGVGAGNLAVDGAKFPSFPFGGTIDTLEYIPGLDGVAGDITLKAAIDGTEVTGSDLNLLVANTGLGDAIPTSSPTAANSFKPGDGLDIEVDAVGTSFTAGSGILRVHLSRYTGGR
jgi:hypothetical protein